MFNRQFLRFSICAGLLVLLGVSLISYGQPFAPQGGAQDKPERVRVYVEFERFSPQAVTAVRAAGGTVHYEFPGQNAVAVTLPQAAIPGLLRNPNIVNIEEDPIREPYAQTTPYGIPMVQADQVSFNGSSGMKVCIIDSGYFKNHNDLQDNGVTSTTDSGTGDPFVDGCGHGTHVAGTVAALDNTEGVVGVVGTGALGLHIVKVFGNNCSWAYSSTLVNAANKCRDAGAKVISMSLGGSFKSRTEEMAFRDLYNQGILSVAAAGNAGTTQKSYPASYPSVISVAAIDSNKVVAGFSQKNDDVELAAPGVAVLSTVPWLDENSLTSGGTTWTGSYIDGAARTGGTSATLFGASGDQCTSASGAYSGKIVLCQRGTNSFAQKVSNVQSAGGAGVAIYNNVASDPSCGVFLGTLNGTSTIPAIGLSCADGAAALGQSGNSSTVVSQFTANASGYEAWDGTSMATPHVSGVAALVWSNHLTCTNDQIRTALQNTAQDLGAAGKDNSYGYGLVQAAAANTAVSCSGGGGGCTLGQAGDPCTNGSQCCSGNCKGKPGAKTCK
ncbi:MAG: S8 family serine peptidase [Acidobacteria bacterium]|nr:S8 family serine peptidase [Acidobacteriota bacterium]